MIEREREREREREHTTMDRGDPACLRLVLSNNRSVKGGVNKS